MDKFFLRYSLEQFGDQCLDKGHFDMWTRGAGDWISDLVIGGRPAPPPTPIGCPYLVVFLEEQQRYEAPPTPTVLQLQLLLIKPSAGSLVENLYCERSTAGNTPKTQDPTFPMMHLEYMSPCLETATPPLCNTDCVLDILSPKPRWDNPDDIIRVRGQRTTQIQKTVPFRVTELFWMMVSNTHQPPHRGEWARLWHPTLTQDGRQPPSFTTTAERFEEGTSLDYKEP